MIGLDTNILARYYIEDADDGESIRQRDAARRLIESDLSLKVSKTVLLELEWVMRGYYRYEPDAIAQVFTHLLSLANITIENREQVESALAHYQAGLDFADALHHAAYGDCAAMASFDDRRFARRVHRMGLQPKIIIPQ